MPKKVAPYKAKHYSIRCTENDKTNKKHRGIRLLGFDFYIDAKEDEEKMKKWLREELDKNAIPCFSITVLKETLIEVLWSKKLISACINNTGYEHG